MLCKHMVPALGECRVAEVEYKDILAFHNSLHQMPTVANRAADVLVKMFSLAVGWGWTSLRRQRVPGRAPLPGLARIRHRSTIAEAFGRPLSRSVMDAVVI